MQYEITRRFGSTGFGDIHQLNGDTDVSVLVKLVHRQYARGIDIEVLRESVARTAAVADHPGINRPLGLCLVQGRAGLLIEAFTGHSLSSLSYGKSMSLKAAIQTVEQIAASLAFAWDGVMVEEMPLQWFHGDLHPSNVYVDRQGQVLLTEFGLSRALLGEEEDLDMQNTATFSSLPYMAPERLLNTRSSTGADIYSLGIFLFELATGSRCVGGPTASIKRAEHKLQLQTLVDQLRQAVPEPNEDLVLMFQQMLAYSPDQRPSAAAVAQRCTEQAASAGGPSLTEWAAVAIPQAAETASTALRNRIVPMDPMLGAPVRGIPIGPPTPMEEILDTPAPTEERIYSGNVPGLDLPSTRSHARVNAMRAVLAVVGFLVVGVIIWVLR